MIFLLLISSISYSEDYQDATTLILRGHSLETLSTQPSNGLRENLIIEYFRSIRNSFFQNNNVIKTVTIRDVRSIGSFAFDNCQNLESVSLHSYSVSIGSYAFRSCVNLSVFRIYTDCSLGEGCFQHCIRLTDPPRSSNLPLYCYYNCSSLTTVSVKSSVELIYDWCFSYCTNLQKVIFEHADQALKIGKSFEHCPNFKTLVAYRTMTYFWPVEQHFPSIQNIENLEYIISGRVENSAFFIHFHNLKNLKITCGSLNGNFPVLNNLDKLYIKTSSIPDNAFERYTMSELEFTGTIIGASAFNACKNLTTIKLPNIITINNRAFYYCTSLSAINLSETLTTLGAFAFNTCSSLRNINITSKIQNIGERAFANCRNLETAFISTNSNLEFGLYSFNQCERMNFINFSSVGDLNANHYGFQQCYALEEAYFSAGTVTIGEWSFRYCSRLAKVVLNAKTRAHIGSNAFANLHNLQEFYILNSTVNAKIWYNVFDSCTNLRVFECNIPCDLSSRTFIGCRSLTNIVASINLPSYCYSGCTSLTQVNISNLVDNVEERCFQNCNNLRSLFIEYHSSKSINFAYNVFEGLNILNLTSLRLMNFVGDYPGNSPKLLTSVKNFTMFTSISNSRLIIRDPIKFTNLTSANITCSAIEGNAFYGIDKLNYLYFRGQNIERDVFQDCSNLQILEAPDLRYCRNNAFRYCRKLKTIDAPRLTEVGLNAFGDCESLIEIKFSNYLRTISPYAFATCRTLYKLSFPSSLNMIDRGAFGWCSNLTIVIFEKTSNELNLVIEVFYLCDNVRVLSIGRPINNH